MKHALSCAVRSKKFLQYGQLNFFANLMVLLDVVALFCSLVDVTTVVDNQIPTVETKIRRQHIKCYKRGKT
jgi:hypothetical protein